MKFKLTAREGEFLHANFRGEKHGQERVPATDLKIRCRGTKRDFDMLFPLQEGKLTAIVWDAKGNLQVNYMSPLKNHRTPEDVEFIVWDQNTKKKDPLQFEGCKVKFGEIVLHDKWNFDLTLTVQLHDDPERDTPRLRRLPDTKCEFQLEAMQEDFFDEDPEEDEDDKQGSLDVKQGGGEKEEEEEEEEE